MHGTSNEGIIGILKDRRFTGSQWLPDGAYFRGTQEERQPAPSDLVALFTTCVHGSKDQRGVLVELTAMAPCLRNKGPRYDKSQGGTSWDMQVCREKKISHFRTGQENRWAAPFDMIAMVALWVREDALTGLHKVGVLRP